MFPDPPEPAGPGQPPEDEPTRTDLRGVLPAQRPPVDVTVLNEPTSEVPVIKVPDDPPPDQPAAADQPEAPVPAGAWEEAAAPVPGTDADADADADEPTTATTDPATQTPNAPEDPDMHDPVFPPRTSEMAKMTWRPAPLPAEPPPGAELAGTEPAPAAWVGPTAAPVPEVVPGVRSLPGFPPPAPPAPELPDGQARPTGPTGTGRPGDVAERPIALWSDPAVDQLRERWRELQGQFVDDPDAAVAGAKRLVTEAVRTLADTLLAAQDQLDPYRETGQVDTETMRVAMRRYREFLERVLAL
jgi:hypothetical protein